MTMTDTEAKALEAWNDVRIKRHEPVLVTASAAMICSPSAFIALCRAIEREAATEARHAAELREQAERFSEAVDAYSRLWSKRTPSRDEYNTHFAPFILPAPDPLVEVMNEMDLGMSKAAAKEFRAAMQARGYEVRKIGEVK